MNVVISRISANAKNTACALQIYLKTGKENSPHFRCPTHTELSPHSSCELCGMTCPTVGILERGGNRVFLQGKSWGHRDPWSSRSQQQVSPGSLVFLLQDPDRPLRSPKNESLRSYPEECIRTHQKEMFYKIPNHVSWGSHTQKSHQHLGEIQEQKKYVKWKIKEKEKGNKGKLYCLMVTVCQCQFLNCDKYTIPR